MGGGRRAPARATGPVAGVAAQFSLAPSIGVSGFVPLRARSIFSSSCVVVRAWCLEVGGAASGSGTMREHTRRPTLVFMNTKTNQFEFSPTDLGMWGQTTST